MSKKSPVNVQKLVYCGPDLQFAGVKQYQVFSNGIPKSLSDRFVDCPEISSLIVEVKDLSKVRSKLNVKGEFENIMYKKILEYKNGVKN